MAAKTSAGTLRQAAGEIRDDAATIATRSVRPFLNAVADWLDDNAAHLEDAGGKKTACDEPGAIDAALTIARAYLSG